MTVDQDQWLPDAPPPRPARREATIDAALRTFDGTAEAPTARQRSRLSWASAHRPQLQLAMSAALLLVIGIPVALIGIGNDRADRAQPPAVPVPHGPTSAPAPPAADSAPGVRLDEEAPRSPLPASSSTADRTDTGEAQTQRASEETNPVAPAPLIAAAPPPPPPPPAEPARSEEFAQRTAPSDVVVTGSLIRNPNLQAVEDRAQKTADARSPAAAGTANRARQASPHSAFVTELQAAVRADDRRAIIALVGLPLRVNARTGTRYYRDARAVERDFERIFTPKVRRAILAQSPDRLFVRDRGAMIGDGEVWFDRSCRNAACSPAGPVRIVAVNP